MSSEPPSRHGHPRFYELLKEIGELHSVKNSGYAEADKPLSNFLECERFGVPAWKGAMVRMSDKWSRAVQLVKKRKDIIGDESLVDTLKDLASYALICVVLLEEANKK